MKFKQKYNKLPPNRKAVFIGFCILLVLSVGFVCGVEYAKNKCFNACIEYTCDNIDPLRDFCYKLSPTMDLTNLSIDVGGFGK